MTMTTAAWTVARKANQPIRVKYRITSICIAHFYAKRLK